MGGGSGCGHGYGAKGGGRITVASGAAFTIGATGEIVADGETIPGPAENVGGGGGGFVILGSASSITVRGSLSARGGAAANTIAAPTETVFGGGGGGGGGILLFAPAVDTAAASLSVAGGVASPLPNLPNFATLPYTTGGGGGGAVGDGGSGGFYDPYGSKRHAGTSGKPGAILTQQTHPANSSFF